jgi:hypothetical protein
MPPSLLMGSPGGLGPMASLPAGLGGAPDMSPTALLAHVTQQAAALPLPATSEDGVSAAPEATAGLAFLLELLRCAHPAGPPRSPASQFALQPAQRGARHAAPDPCPRTARTTHCADSLQTSTSLPAPTPPLQNVCQPGG